MEFADRQAFYEGSAHLWRDHVLTVGFPVIGGKLRQELVIGNSGRSIETGIGFDLFAYPQRDVPSQRKALTDFQ
jgi:hypothetical protein